VTFSRRDFVTTITINSEGLRDRERPLQKPAGEFRVVALGDSFLEAYMMKDEETPTEKLRADLAGPGCAVDVVNGGTFGYSTDQEYLAYDRDLHRYQPDVVVLFVYHNDIPPLLWGPDKPVLDFSTEPPRVSNEPVTSRFPGGAVGAADQPASSTPVASPAPAPPQPFLRSEALALIQARLETASPRLRARLERVGLVSPLRPFDLNDELFLYARQPPEHLVRAIRAFQQTLGALKRRVMKDGRSSARRLHPRPLRGESRGLGAHPGPVSHREQEVRSAIPGVSSDDRGLPGGRRVPRPDRCAQGHARLVRASLTSTPTATGTRAAPRRERAQWPPNSASSAGRRTAPTGTDCAPPKPRCPMGCCSTHLEGCRIRDMRRRPNFGDGISTGAREVHAAVRSLRRAPGFATTAIVVLTVTLAANIVVFSIADAVFFKPLPFREPESLAMLRSVDTSRGTPVLAVPALVAALFGEADNAVSSLALVGGRRDLEIRGGLEQPIRAREVTENLLEMLGAAPVVGRVHRSGDAGAGEPARAVLSHAYWLRRFGSDPSVIGSLIPLDKGAIQVVGVLPKSFLLPSPGDRGFDVLLPVLAPRSATLTGADNFVAPIVRLRHDRVGGAPPNSPL
jgi:hypothetical protein